MPEADISRMPTTPYPLTVAPHTSALQICSNDYHGCLPPSSGVNVHSYHTGICVTDIKMMLNSS